MVNDSKIVQYKQPLTLSDNFDAGFYEPTPSEKTLRFSNGDYYQGETLADLRHGNGRHICSNGDTHDGGWYKGMRHGKGKASFARGFFYEGDFQYDRAHGNGKAKYENGAIYDGEFSNDQRSGWGMQMFPDESMYEGEWENDCMQGSGRLTLEDGSYYEGKWEGGQCKRGVWRSKDRRQEYSGQWVDGKKEGEGILIVDGLFHYKGKWKDDVQEGYGKCKWIDGTVYDGMWKNGQRNGKGKILRADGCKYDGQWEDDKEHGQGNARLQNGDRYHGEFVDGEPNGSGRSRSLDGDRYEGEWKDGKKHGEGRCIFANGDRYQGEWARGKRHGQGVCHFANGNVFRGEWQEDHWIQSEAEPSLCRVAGIGLSRCVAGEEASFSILARDSLGNKRLSGGDNFLVWLEGPATVHAVIKDQEDGSFLVTYVASKSGMYDLYITNETGESVAEAPYPMRAFATEPQPRKSLIKLPRNLRAHTNQPCRFLVELYDEFDNRCKVADAGSEMPIEAEVSCGTEICYVDIKPGNSGQHHCSFVPKIPGFYRLAVTSGNEQLKNSPISIQVLNLEDGESEVPVEFIKDESREWEKKAEQQYREDGNADGWETDDSQPETAEEKYRREHPDVPVVENLEDMWKVTKLQRERKKKEEKARALKEMAELQRASTSPEERHPERAPLIGNSPKNRSPQKSETGEEEKTQTDEKTQTSETQSDADQKKLDADSLRSRNSEEEASAENFGGVDSLHPEESVFQRSASIGSKMQKMPPSNRFSIDKGGFLTSLSEISDVSSLSSKLTTFGLDGMSSGEALPLPSPQDKQ